VEILKDNIHPTLPLGRRALEMERKRRQLQQQAALLLRKEPCRILPWLRKGGQA